MRETHGSSNTFGHPWLAARGQVSSLGTFQKRKGRRVFSGQPFPGTSRGSTGCLLVVKRSSWLMVNGGGVAAFLQKVSHMIITFKIIIILELNFDPPPMVPTPSPFNEWKTIETVSFGV